MWNAGRGKLAGTPLPSLRGRWDSRSTRCGNSRGGGRSLVGRSGDMSLQRLVLDFRNSELVVRCLYRSKGDSNPGTKGRRREVAALTRTGLPQALEVLEAGVDVDMVGTSGFTSHEAILSRDTRPQEAHLL